MERIALNQLSEKIIGASIEVHKILGPGLLESTYKAALLEELKLNGIKAAKEIEIPCIYKGLKLDCSFRADIIVENQIILELKSVEQDNPVYWKQLYTYLRLTNKKLGLLINFNKARLIDGLTRIVNNF